MNSWRSRPNNAFKPKLHRYASNMAEGACLVVHDRWQYCHVVIEELKNDPTLEKELGYHWCEKPA